MNHIIIPKGIFRENQDGDNIAAAKRRKKLREMLLRGEHPTGRLKSTDEKTNKPTITIPEGKLAGFYWYENEPDLYNDEIKVMNHFFPKFELGKLNDNRLFWKGFIETDLRKDGYWYLMLIYDHNHPHNNNFGGSIKVYSIEPDLDKLTEDIGSIPHILYDENNSIYLCTARMEDVEAGNIVTSAAVSLSWAAKWINAFELWRAGDITFQEFRDLGE